MAAALCGPAAATIKIAPAEKGYDFDIDAQTTASELIDAIASATGVDIKGEPQDTTVGPNHLRNTSLERALRKLLPKAPFAVRFDADDTPEAIIFLTPSEGGGGANGSDGADSPDTGDDSSDDSSDDSGSSDEQDTPEDSSSDGG